MLREETDRNLCDSGGMYGYAYECRRQIRNFDDLPGGWLTVYRGDLMWTKSTYQVLIRHLTYDAEMTRRLASLLRSEADQNATQSDIIEGFIADVADSYDDVIGGDGTNNGDGIMDVHMSYDIFRRDGQSYIILSIHGGCDIRWGYTRPRVFTLDDVDSFLMEFEDLTMECNCIMVNNYDIEDIGEDEQKFIRCQWVQDGRQVACASCKKPISVY